MLNWLVTWKSQECCWEPLAWGRRPGRKYLLGGRGLASRRLGGEEGGEEAQRLLGPGRCTAKAPPGGSSSTRDAPARPSRCAVGQAGGSLRAGFRRDSRRCRLVGPGKHPSRVAPVS